MLNRERFIMQPQQLQYFEYFLLKTFSIFIANNHSSLNDLSVLKCQKLLFFTVAVNAQAQRDRAVLGSQVFNNFKAYQYGPVEETIYDSLKEGNNELSHLNLTFQRLELKFEKTELNGVINGISDSMLLDKSILNIIDNSIIELNRKNPFLIRYSPFNLVDLSHRWRCWSFAFSRGARSPISIYEIEKESMSFSL